MVTIPFGLAMSALTECAGVTVDEEFWQLIADRLLKANNEKSVLLAGEILSCLKEAQDDGSHDEVKQ